MSVRILQGDVRAVLATLPSDHFDVCVTSPPYWGLRSYLTAGHADKPLEIGLEPTLGEHLAALVGVFRDVRRVLKPSGVCFINYGDCYATAPNGRSAADTKAAGDDDRTFRDKPFSTVGPIMPPEPGQPFPDGIGRRGGGNAPAGPIFEEDLTGRQVRRGARSQGLHDRKQSPVPSGRVVAGGFLKPKDLCLIPQRLAIALQDDGWFVRSMMPWVKRNGMPESIKDRPATSLEYMMMLTKSQRYYWDAEAVRLPASASTNARVAQDVANQAGSTRANGGRKTNGPMKAVIRAPGVTPKSAGEDTNIKAKGSFHASTTEVLADRNFRNTDLFFSSLEAPFGLISNAEGDLLGMDVNPQGFREAHFATFPEKLVEPLLRAACPKGGAVLDPFGGAGTVGLVADRLALNATLIELNSDSIDIADRRIRDDAGLFAEVAA